MGPAPCICREGPALGAVRAHVHVRLRVRAYGAHAGYGRMGLLCFSVLCEVSPNPESGTELRGPEKPPMGVYIAWSFMGQAVAST